MLPSASCESVGTSICLVFSGLNSPACAYPYRRFAAALTNDRARLGATVDRYSFDVELSHLLLHAGLSRRRHNLAKLHRRPLATVGAEHAPRGPAPRPTAWVQATNLSLDARKGR